MATVLRADLREARAEAGRPVRRCCNNQVRDYWGLDCDNRSEPGNILKVKLTCFADGLMRA